MSNNRSNDFLEDVFLKDNMFLTDEFPDVFAEQFDREKLNDLQDSKAGADGFSPTETVQDVGSPQHLASSVTESISDTVASSNTERDKEAKKKAQLKDRRYYESHKEIISKKNRERYVKNSKEIRERISQYQKAHKEVINARHRESRAKKKAAALVSKTPPANLTVGFGSTSFGVFSQPKILTITPTITSDVSKSPKPKRV